MTVTSALVTADDVVAAAGRLRDVALRTPLERNARLSAATGAEVWLKREDLQVIRSYKVRGAFNFIASLTADEQGRGVICASAGNHAQGVAYSCARLGVRGHIFVPCTTPRQKRERIAFLGGASVTLTMAGDTYDDASTVATEWAAREGLVLVPPFDDPRTIAGQATVAREIFEQIEGPVDLLVAPIGGGGLISGLSVWGRSLAQTPPLRVVGVEPAGAASMTAALEAGRPVPLPEIDTFVDGAAVRQVGAHTFELTRALVDQVVAVDEGRVCTEMLALYQSDGVIAEPAGALATAALGHSVDVPEGATVVCVVSGGNNDVSRYGEIVERSLIHEGLKHYYLVEFPQEPGALRRFLDHVLGPDDDITLFEYVKKNNRETGPALVGIELADRDDLAPLQARMADSPLNIEPIPPGSPIFAFLV